MQIDCLQQELTDEEFILSSSRNSSEVVIIRTPSSSVSSQISLNNSGIISSVVRSKKDFSIVQQLGSQVISVKSFPDEDNDEDNDSIMISNSNSSRAKNAKSEHENGSSASHGKLSSKSNNKWAFLLDPLFVVHSIMLSFIIAALYALIALLMDFTKIKGHAESSSGALMVFVFFVSSMFGKILAGVMNLVPAFRSTYLLCVFGTVSSVVLVVLNYVSEYMTLCVMISVLGTNFGGIAAIYPKCVLDMDSVRADMYPVAFGITNTMAGCFDALLPIVIGYSVDVTKSYTLILHTYGVLGICLSLALLITSCWTFKIKKHR